MRDRLGKVILYSTGETDYREWTFRTSRIAWYLAGFAFVVAVITVSLSVALSSLIRDYRVTSLRKANQSLLSELKQMRSKVTDLETKLASLERTDNDLRLFVNLPPIDDDVRSMGVGGNVHPALEDVRLGEAGRDVMALDSYLDQLERRVQLAFESRREIEEKYKENSELLKHTPTIRPVVGGRITSGFGYRLDPFIERIRHHDGVDIAAPQGTQVFAAADGVVEKVVTRAVRGRGYGKEVIINHGNGIKTRYAHLSRVLVRPGQKVKRWDVVGLVGQTGRARGPHLHYEVIVNGRPTDPMAYILN